MQVNNGNELDLAGSDGETITVAISGANGVLNNYVLNGRSWPGGSFKLDKGVAPVFKLLVQTVYELSSGASCEITVSGSESGDTSIHDEIQSPGEAFDAAMYTITVL